MGSSSKPTRPADLDLGGDDAPSTNGELPAAPTHLAAPLLPPNLVLTEPAAADFRRWLADQGCGDWTVFHSGDDELYDIEQYLDDLIEGDGERPGWHHAPPLSGPAGQAEGPEIRNSDGDAVLPGAMFPPGFLMVSGRGVAIARWYWIDPEFNTSDTLYLAACASTEAYEAVRDDVKKLRHGGNKAVWQIVRGPASHDGPRVARRRNAGRELIIGESLQKQIDRDLIGFFRPKVRRLYKKLEVPYRRGVLLHGPPGNGKTSLIRMLGAKLPKVPFLVLRTSRNMNDGALRAIVDRWRAQAPAVLVIEDLNWLLEQVEVSQFLNLIDGIERDTAKGLLLLATTNYPEKLDPAVNNRPGRFDVVIELPNPDEPLRRAFLDKTLPDIGDAARAIAAKRSQGLSFAHLREVLRLSGLLAIEEDRDDRADDDITRAVELVWESHDRALRGFPRAPDLPFGLQHQR